MAALLGADEFSFGTAALLAEANVAAPSNVLGGYLSDRLGAAVTTSDLAVGARVGREALDDHPQPRVARIVVAGLAAGALVVARDRRNLYGWALCLVPLCFEANLFTGAYSTYGTFTVEIHPNIFAFGVLTTETIEQAEARIDRVAEVVRGALEMANVFQQLRAAAK
jgi:hypothetical protein